MAEVTSVQHRDVPSEPVRRPEWVAHVLDESTGEPHAVLLHLPRGERTALSPTATRVWQLIVAAGAKGVQTADLCPALAAEYGADPEIVSQDVAGLMTQLLAGEWVERVPAVGGDGE